MKPYMIPELIIGSRIKSNLDNLTNLTLESTYTKISNLRTNVSNNPAYSIDLL